MFILYFCWDGTYTLFGHFHSKTFMCVNVGNCQFIMFISYADLVLPMKSSFIVIKYIFVSNCLSLGFVIIYNYINTRCDMAEDSHKRYHD